MTGTRGNAKILGQVGRGKYEVSSRRRCLEKAEGKRGPGERQTGASATEEGRAAWGMPVGWWGQDVVFPSHLKGQHHIQGSFTPCPRPGRAAGVK